MAKYDHGNGCACGLYKECNSDCRNLSGIELEEEFYRYYKETGGEPDVWPLKDNSGGGHKYDNGKVRFELLPPELLWGVASVLTFGAIKYGDRNFEKGMHWSRPFGALMRHMWAWWGGQGQTTKSFLFGDLDEETKMSHLWHAGCCIAFLITYEERQIGTDDRHKG